MQFYKAVKRSNELRTRFVILVYSTTRDMRFLKFMFIMLLQAVKTVNWAENTICDTCGLNSRRYDIFEVLAHTVVISLKTVI